MLCAKNLHAAMFLQFSTTLLVCENDNEINRVHCFVYSVKLLFFNINGRRWCNCPMLPRHLSNFSLGPGCVRSCKTTTNLQLCLKDEPNREDERMFTPLIRQEVCLHTRMQREHSEEEVMAERPYQNNAYRPLLTVHPDNLTATGTWA